MNLDYITSVEEANEAIKGYSEGWLYLDGLTSADKETIKKANPEFNIL